MVVALRLRGSNASNHRLSSSNCCARRRPAAGCGARGKGTRLLAALVSPRTPCRQMHPRGARHARASSRKSAASPPRRCRRRACANAFVVLRANSASRRGTLATPKPTSDSPRPPQDSPGASVNNAKPGGVLFVNAVCGWQVHRLVGFAMMPMIMAEDAAAAAPESRGAGVRRAAARHPPTRATRFPYQWMIPLFGDGLIGLIPQSGSGPVAT